MRYLKTGLVDYKTATGVDVPFRSYLATTTV
jgi:hypothetical protein